jgi:hypothetical protein
MKKIIYLVVMLFTATLLHAQNVGIGTTTPSHRLDVVGSTTNALIRIENSNPSLFSYGTWSFSENSVGVFAQSLNGKALVAFNNSTANPTVDFTNGLAGGITLKTKGKNTFDGTTYSSLFNTGTNEDTYIRSGKPAGNVIINDNNNNTIIGSTSSKVGIANSNPQTTLDVFGNIKVGGNTAYGNGMYSDNTYSTLTPGLGLNIIPIGVIGFRSRKETLILGNNNIDEAFNIAGNLVGEMVVGTSNNRKVGRIYLNNAITSQYSEVISIGQPGYDNLQNTSSYYLMELHSRVIKNVFYNGNFYNKVFDWYAETDGLSQPNHEVYGTIMFYGIK